MSEMTIKDALGILEMLKNAELIEDHLVIGTWYAQLGKKIEDALSLAISTLEEREKRGKEAADE